MAALGIILRIVIFLAIVVPLLWWVVTRAKRARNIPTDHQHDHLVERARSQHTETPNNNMGGW